MIDRCTLTIESYNAVDGLECQGLENNRVLVRFCCRQALLLTEAEVELVITNDE